MRTVFPTRDVAKVWATQSQFTGKNPQGNLFFRDSVIYNYGDHFPIAKFVKNEAGETAVRFNADKYSVTTAKHIGLVVGALAPGLKSGAIKGLFLTHNVEAQNHTMQQNFYAEEIGEKMRKADRARKYRDSHLERAVLIMREALAYSAFYDLDWGTDDLAREITADQFETLLDRLDNTRTPLAAGETRRVEHA